jgi:hypothetical protein
VCVPVWCAETVCKRMRLEAFIFGSAVLLRIHVVKTRSQVFTGALKWRGLKQALEVSNNRRSARMFGLDSAAPPHGRLILYVRPARSLKSKRGFAVHVHVATVAS